MDIDITNFLPKYPNISPMEEKNLNPYETDFYETIYKKNEFYQNKLEKIEKFPENKGQLMNHQKLVARFFSSNTLYDELLLVHEMGCVAPETPILKWDGSIVHADTITEGDVLIGDDGNPRKVTALIQGKSEMFKIEQNKADSYIVNSNHILTLNITGNYAITWTESTQTWSLKWFDKKELKDRVKTIKCSNITKEEGYDNIVKYRDSIRTEDNTLDITVKDYLNLSKTGKAYLKGYKCSGINWESSPVNLDPYILGMWLGDSNNRGDGFTTDDSELLEYWKNWARQNNCIIKSAKNSDIGFYICQNDKNTLFFIDILRQYNLKDNKHIPREYIVNDRNTRLKVLAGLIDTDGYVYNDGTCIEILQKNKVLAEDICYLIRSLGYSCIIKQRKKSCTYKGEKKEGIYYALNISGNNLEEIPTLIPRKKIKPRNQVNDPLVTQITVTSIGEGDYVGWELDVTSNKRFLLGDFTVTHNTGKSCSAVGAIEQIRSEGGGFRGALYLATGETLVNNFIDEIVFKCTDGRYIPEGYDELTDLEKVHRKKKAIKDYYALNTFETFAKEISKLSDDIIKKRYNNTIIIIDEVHNLRIQDNEEGFNLYRQFWRFLHIIEDCKILLMSGTPMRDGVDEISSVMNLILPINEQLPTGQEFLNKYFIKNGQDSYQVKENMKNFLKNVFKGRISYLKAMQSNIQKVFSGNPEGTLKHFKVVNDEMSDFQSQVYMQAYNDDSQGRKGVYLNSRQASLFVFPDGSYGSKGYEKYIEKRKTRTGFRYSLTSDMRKQITADTTEQMLKNLSRFSSKYAASIQNILDAREQNKSVFLYNSFVEGSGLILFSLILDLFGFSKSYGGEATGDEKARYAVITSGTATTKQVRSIVNRFNQPDNMYGKIINVIMGSARIAEGFSFMNVQVEEIQTPWFNYSVTAQAIARGFRLGSHQMLLETGNIPELTVIQRVSLPRINNSIQYSIDLYMYEMSERKDVSIKGVEKLIKESAWDCALTYERNHITGYDGQRECDYTDCNYKCDGIPANMIDNELDENNIDYSTYDIYYSSPRVRKIVENVLVIFKTNFRMDLDTLLKILNEYTVFEVITGLRTIINESIKIINKYGYPSYLKEVNNIFFLVDSLSVSGTFLSDYYTKYPHINKSLSYYDIIDKIQYSSFPNIVEMVCSAKNLEEFKKYIVQLPKNIQEMFIESSILAAKNNIQTNVEIRNIILTYYSDYFGEYNQVWVSWYLFNDTGLLRCLEDNEWKDCDESYIDIIKQKKEENKQSVEELANKIANGYYGLENDKIGQFCIKKVMENEPEKGHKKLRGQVCTTKDRKDLIDIVVNKLILPIPENDKIPNIKKPNVNVMNQKELERLIQNNKYSKDMVQNISTIGIDELRRIVFWTSLMKPQLCLILREWFRERNLLVKDEACGSFSAKK